MHSAELCSTDHLLELCPRMADTTMALHGRPISCPAFQSTLSPVMNISRSGIVGYKQVKYAGQEVGIFWQALQIFERLMKIFNTVPKIKILILPLHIPKNGSFQP